MLDPGEVNIDEETGDHTGDGMALALYEKQIVLMDGIIDTMSVEDQVNLKEGLADFCKALAEGIVTYLVGNADVAVTITTSDTGLQRTPDPNSPNTNTQGPSANRTLTGSIE